MELEEIRIEIDRIDNLIKPLFLERMDYAKQVAQSKAKNGGDVFVQERELAIIERRAGDVEGELHEEYVAFLRHLLSVSRRYQYGILTDMQETVLKEMLEKEGLSAECIHNKVRVGFICDKQNSDLNLHINMIRLNAVEICSINVSERNGKLVCELVLDGNVNDANMKRLICQLGKEAAQFELKELL